MGFSLMNETPRAFLQRALAVAHAALEEPTSERIRQAQLEAAEVYPRMRRFDQRALTLAEARELAVLVARLREVIGALSAV
jgi:hypothetical protein